MGDSFPAFDLSAHDGTRVRSSGLGGSPYLAYFYPKADTPGCTKEACALRDAWHDVRAKSLRVFGISYDRPEENRVFAEKFRLPFLLLSDSDHALAKKVGANRFLLPYPKRISYLVGGDGRVLRAYSKVRPSEHAMEVLGDLAGSGAA